MKLFIIRLLLFALFFLLFSYVINVAADTAVMWAFVCTYIIEPYLASKV